MCSLLLLVCYRWTNALFYFCHFSASKIGGNIVSLRTEENMSLQLPMSNGINNSVLFAVLNWARWFSLGQVEVQPRSTSERSWSQTLNCPDLGRWTKFYCCLTEVLELDRIHIDDVPCVLLQINCFLQQLASAGTSDSSAPCKILPSIVPGGPLAYGGATGCRVWTVVLQEVQK